MRASFHLSYPSVVLLQQTARKPLGSFDQAAFSVRFGSGLGAAFRGSD